MATRHPAQLARGFVADGSVGLGPMHAWPRAPDEFGADTDGLLASIGLRRAEFADPVAGLVGCNLMRALCGPEWRPAEVALPFRSRGARLH